MSVARKAGTAYTTSQNMEMAVPACHTTRAKLEVRFSGSPEEQRRVGARLRHLTPSSGSPIQTHERRDGQCSTARSF